MIKTRFDAFVNEDRQTVVVFVIENLGEESVTFGTTTSSWYSLTASSASVESYGDSYGAMMAPHHITLPVGESLVISRTYENDDFSLSEFTGMEFEDDQPYDLLDPSIEETVTLTLELYCRNQENIKEQVTFIPDECGTGTVSDRVDLLRTQPLTDNSLQMG